jgi:hypothetical protein
MTFRRKKTQTNSNSGSSGFFMDPEKTAFLGFSIDDVAPDKENTSGSQSHWLLWVVIIFFAGLLALGGWLWSGGQVTELTQRLDRGEEALTGINERLAQLERMFPTPAPPTPTAVNITALEQRLNTIEQAILTPPPPTPVVTTTPALSPSPEIGRQINAQITPIVSMENNAGIFLLTNNAHWSDIPDLQVQILEENIRFQLNTDESSYEVWDNDNNRLGLLRIQIWQNDAIIDEYVYPALEGTLTEDNPNQLFIIWKNTGVKLLPPGEYELRLVTQRDLDRQPLAMIGEPQPVTITKPIDVQVYNPTATDSQTRLRTYPAWNCSEACAKTDDLPVNVQAVGYIVMPFWEAGTPLPYKLPLLPSPPMLSFPTEITTTKEDETGKPVTISPDTPITPDNMNDYSDDSGIIYVESNENAKFFLVRLPGSRDYYWLGEIDTLEFYNPEYRDRLLSLPPFVRQE